MWDSSLNRKKSLFYPVIGKAYDWLVFSLRPSLHIFEKQSIIRQWLALNIKQGINSNYGRQSKRSCGLPIRMIGVNFNSEKGRIDGWKEMAQP